MTVTGPSRVQITVSHQRIDVAATGGYLVVFTVTNRTPEAVEVAVEAPYYAPNQLIWQTDAQVMYQLDASEQTVLAFGSAAFTLRISVQQLPSFEVTEQLRARVTTAGGSDAVLSPPVDVRYFAYELSPPLIAGDKLVEPGTWKFFDV